MSDTAEKTHQTIVICFDHPRPKFPTTQPMLNIVKARDDLVDCGTLGWVVLNHIGNQVYHEVKPESALSKHESTRQ
jgi:hypothetical protein